jgi:hypothetical protein
MIEKYSSEGRVGDRGDELQGCVGRRWRFDVARL